MAAGGFGCMAGVLQGLGAEAAGEVSVLFCHLTVGIHSCPLPLPAGTPPFLPPPTPASPSGPGPVPRLDGINIPFGRVVEGMGVVSTIVTVRGWSRGRQKDWAGLGNRAQCG